VSDVEGGSERRRFVFLERGAAKEEVRCIVALSLSYPVRCNMYASPRSEPLLTLGLGLRLGQ